MFSEYVTMEFEPFVFSFWFLETNTFLNNLLLLLVLDYEIKYK